ncbi:methane monooxygenase PmoA-like [Salegentibacter salegens]|nr:methane monooxygenase PmoA-like [Salegentibacter salegens]
MVLLSLQHQLFSQELEFQKDKEGVLLLEDEKPRYFYQEKSKSLDGKYARANYVHPLYNNNSEIITEDFPEDHLHHHGIFWSWHQLYAEGKRVGDPWLSEGISWQAEVTETTIKEKTAVLKAEIHWFGETDKNPVLKENLELIYERFNPKTYALTFKIRLTALKDGVSIGGSQDAKGYGGFSPRLKLPGDVVFESRDGIVNPQNLPVKAGPWMNIEGNFDNSGEITGIVIMGKPEDLPNYQGWILRKSRSMQNMAFPGRDPIAIKKDESLEFKNQILVHQNLRITEIEDYYKKFQKVE